MRFSVITINYNNRDGLQKTINSVITQTSNDYEYIIIDGGSTDGSKEVIEQYADSLSYWVSEPDRGIYHAMNKGIAQAKGEYCIFMNSGDCFYDENVLQQVTKYSEDIIVGRVLTVDGRTELFSPPQQGKLTLYFLYSATIAHQGAFIKVSLQKKHLYDETLKIVSDWKFFLYATIIDGCSVRFIPMSVCRFDTSGVSTSNPEKMWNEKEKVLKEVFPERILADYQRMKESECHTQAFLPYLRKHYRLDVYISKLLRILSRQ